MKVVLLHLSACALNLPEPTQCKSNAGHYDTSAVAAAGDIEHEVFADGITNEFENYELLFLLEEKEAGMDKDVMVRSLKRCVLFGEEMGACPFVLKIIQEGYVLPFVALPEAKVLSNHKSANLHRTFVQESVESLVKRGCVLKVEASDVTVCSPLGVVNNGKKLRLILDLRYLNEHLAKFKFKLEDIRTVGSVYEKGDYIVTFDLKSSYNHIQIAPEHYRYLAFRVPDASGHMQSFVFCVLPFGLSTEQQRCTLLVELCNL